MTRALAAALLLAAGLAAAQTPPAKKPDNSAQKAQIADLNSQEKKAMDAVNSDGTLSKSASDAAKKKIHADFKAKKDAIRVRMKGDRKTKRAQAAPPAR
ncbi:MAG: hypothetical protein ACHQ49_00325 [Elusimicrobiota bacterium]